VSVTLETSGEVVPAALAWSADRRRLSILLLEPLEAGTHWRLSIDASAQDLAGNGLDGRGDGSGAPFETRGGDSGVVADAPTDCTRDLFHFTPDGDDGSGEEQDSVAFGWGSAADPEAWVWRVFGGEDVRASGWMAGSARAGAWDGRADDGRVVSAGTYTWELRARDADGVEGSACTLEVTVREAFSAP
jgi:hypothetical protein